MGYIRDGRGSCVIYDDEQACRECGLQFRESPPAPADMRVCQTCWRKGNVLALRELLATATAAEMPELKQVIQRERAR